MHSSAVTARHALIALTCAVWLFALSATATTADKSGVQPTVLSLPSGPGSIEGLGESFQPQLNSGTASYAVPFAVPPGRAGFAPSIGIA
ncbi:hypothetical protein [uncultured Thiodictyon sp.]|uniref:hypothetical protein n=1 Tax=uncultured Thiodictyon sp. TaxID=1846217 RepID=UPI002600059B|nr:hypothetical protein [uncultured Thiodictyon sp.]